MTDTVTLPRKVVKRVMDALYYTATTKSKHPNQWKEEDEAMKELRAALEQPQDHTEQNLNMVPVGWKLVPVEPTDEMVKAGDHEIEKWGVDASSSGAFRAMLAASPQLPVVEQPQVKQEPVGEAGSMPGTDGFTIACFRASDVPVGTKLYTRRAIVRATKNGRNMK